MTEKKNSENKVLVPEGFTEKLHPRRGRRPAQQPQQEEPQKQEAPRRSRRPMAQIGKKPAAPAPQPAKAADQSQQAAPQRGKKGQRQPQEDQGKRQGTRRQQKGRDPQPQQTAPQPPQKQKGGQKAQRETQRPRRGKALMENSTLMLAPESVKCPLKRGNHQLKPGRPTLKIISLGGLGEIGKNITVYECGEDLLVVDCGLAFPDDDLLGVDMVIPDYTYLTRNRERIRGVFLTHGHEDHIGGLPYLLREVNVPVYGTALTLGLVEGKLREHGLVGKVKLSVVRPGETIRAGCMAVRSEEHTSELQSP